MEPVDWVGDRIDAVTDLVHGAAILVAVATVAAAYYRTRSMVAVLVTALLAGIFLWMINNVGWWQTKVEEETAPATLDVDNPVDTPVVAANSDYHAWVIAETRDPIPI